MSNLFIFFKIFFILLACLGLAHCLGNGDKTNTAIVFFSIVILITHLEWKIEANKTVVTINGKVIVRNGRIINPE